MTRAVLLDMEGVLHVDWQPIEGSPEAVRALEEAGLRCAVVTNTTTKTREQIAGRLAELGYALPAERIVTAASAAAEHLRREHAGVAAHLLVDSAAREEFDGVEDVDDPADAGVIVLGGPDERWTYGALNAIFRAVREGTPLVAMQKNRWWPTASGPALDAGAFVCGLEYAAGIRATVVGKPSPAIYETACALAGAAPHDSLMVGDDPESDLAPARELGMRTCLVRTGKGASFDVAPGAVDLDLERLAALPEALLA